MTARKQAVGSTGAATEGNFVNRMVEFKDELGRIEKEIEDQRRAFSEAGKKLREIEKRKNKVVESVAAYVLNAQKELI